MLNDSVHDIYIYTCVLLLLQLLLALLAMDVTPHPVKLIAEGQKAMPKLSYDDDELLEAAIDYLSALGASLQFLSCSQWRFGVLSKVQLSPALPPSWQRQRRLQ